MALHDWAEALLGAPVLVSRGCTGGFSSGVATRVRATNGMRLFVKAVCPALNPHSPALHRAEARIGQMLAGFPISAPRLRGVLDDGDWVALAFDDIAGAPPVWPWNGEQLQRTLDGLGDLHATLAGVELDLPDARTSLAEDLNAWSLLLLSPAKLATLSPWLQEHAGDFSRRVAAMELDGPTVLNLDVRADNVVIDVDGKPWFVDWPWACRGPAHLDVVVLLVNAAVAGQDPENFLAGSSVAHVDPVEITAALAVLAGVWSLATTRPEPPGTRGMRQFQRAHLGAVERWLQQRLG
ncbi:MAG: aminoglycoside phosphotransferase [Pseudonocardiales bacterium]|nr:aminoglycoside phosphotransferase [Pseudonocardiales bacterium]